MSMRVVLWFLCLCLAGCGSHPSPSTKQLRLAIAEDPPTVDPRKAGDLLSSTLLFYLFEGLVYLHADGSISPAQCSHFSLSADKKTYTFFFGTKFWSDGSPVTSYDFANTWKEILSPLFPSFNAHLFYPIQNAQAVKQGLLPEESLGIHTPDANTLIVTLEHPTPYFLQLISFCSFFPYKGEGVFNGPFILERYTPQKELLLVKSPSNTSSAPDSIYISVIPDANTALQMYLQDNLDLIGDPFCSIPPIAIESIPADERLFCPVAATSIITFNTLTPPFSNKKLRQALHLSIDRKKIADALLEFGEKPAFSAVPPSLLGNTPCALYSDNNPKLARLLLQEALKELELSTHELEKSLHYFYVNTYKGRLIAQILQQEWKETLGIDITLCNMDTKTLLQSITDKKYTFAQTLYRAQYADPLSILERFVRRNDRKNYPSWEDPSYAAFIEESSFFSDSARLSLLRKAETLLLEQVPFSPLFHESLCYAKKKHLSGIELSPSGGIFFERLSIR